MAQRHKWNSSVVWRTKEEKEKIEIHEELMIIQQLRCQRDKNFNFV